MLKYRMPYFLFTFRPQISEQELFENFLTIFLPIIQAYPKYSYSVEEDGTLQKHIHCLLYEPNEKKKDYSKFSQIFNQKRFTDFKKSLFTKQTNESGFDNRMVKETDQDLLKVIGYVNKETNCLRRAYAGFTNEEILNGVDYYYTCKHIDKSVKKSDLTIITPKNIHIIIKTFCEENKIEPTDPTLKYRMNAQGYCFSQCPKVQETMHELESIMFPERYTYDDTPNRDYSHIEKRLRLYEMFIQSLGKELPTGYEHISGTDTKTGFDVYEFD